MTLSEWLPARSSEWEALVAKHGLAGSADVMDFCGYNSLVYTDLMLSSANRQRMPALNSTIAARQAGFHDCIDTEDMFRKWFERFRERRLLPPLD